MRTGRSMPIVREIRLTSTFSRTGDPWSPARDSSLPVLPEERGEEKRSRRPPPCLRKG